MDLRKPSLAILLTLFVMRENGVTRWATARTLLIRLGCLWRIFVLLKRSLFTPSLVSTIWSILLRSFFVGLIRIRLTVCHWKSTLRKSTTSCRLPCRECRLYLLSTLLTLLSLMFLEIITLRPCLFIIWLIRTTELISLMWSTTTLMMVVLTRWWRPWIVTSLMYFSFFLSLLWGRLISPWSRILSAGRASTFSIIPTSICF